MNKASDKDTRILQSKRKASSFTLIIMFVCVSLVGIALMPLLPIKLNPSRTLPGFNVQFNMPDASARVVEMKVTSKLEAMLARIKGVKNINSTSGNGWGSITIELDKYANIDAARFEASTIVRQIWPQLPDGVSYPYIEMKRSDDEASRPFLSYTLNAPSTPILIQKYAEEHIKPRLSQLEGIYKIELSGATPMEWKLEYDSEQLNQLGVSLDAIKTAVNQYFQKDFLGTYDIENSKGKQEWIRLVLVPQPTQSSFNPAAIQVVQSNGKLIRLDQVVKVSRVEEAPQSYYRINGLNSIYLSITAEETANQLQLSKNIKTEMKKLEQILPAGYEVHISSDSTEYIQEELNKIYTRTGLTLLILLAFVLVITFNPRYLFLIVVSLIVNICRGNILLLSVWVGNTALFTGRNNSFA